MDKTTNYQLNKPGASDFAEIGQLNVNMDVVDTELKKADTHREDGAVHVTAEQKASWDAKETPAGAQAKADQAKADAEAASIPLTAKGQANGVATLDGTGKVPSAQLPAMNYDPAGSAGAVQTNLDGHIADTVKHVTAAERTDWNSKASGNHTHTAAQVGARPADWLPTAAEINAVPTNRTVNGQALSADISLTAADVDSIPASEKEAAGGVPALDSTGKILPKHIGATSSSGTDYSTPRLRNIRAGIEDMTAGTSALNSGEIYLVYE